MTSEVKIKGILRYPHVFTPSAPPGTTTRRYSAELLVLKTDPAMQTVIAAMEAEKLATFPAGAPANATYFITDMATVQNANPALHPYYSVTFSTNEEQGQPLVVDAACQPVVNPNEVNPGDVVWISGAAKGFTVGNSGVKAYFNGLMTTGEKGTLPLELLSSRPTAAQMFGSAPQPAVPVATAPAVPVATAPAVPVATAPAVPAVPAAAPAAVPAPAAPAARTMTAAANGATYEAMIAAGWTDETLISNGMMVAPAGVPTAF